MLIGKKRKMNINLTLNDINLTLNDILIGKK